MIGPSDKSQIFRRRQKNIQAILKHKVFNESTCYARGANMKSRVFEMLEDKHSFDS